MWDLPGPGLEPVSPALAGAFSTTAPPGKPPDGLFASSSIISLSPSWSPVWSSALHQAVWLTPLPVFATGSKDVETCPRGLVPATQLSSQGRPQVSVSHTSCHLWAPWTRDAREALPVCRAFSEGSCKAITHIFPAATPCHISPSES